MRATPTVGGAFKPDGFPIWRWQGVARASCPCRGVGVSPVFAARRPRAGCPCHFAPNRKPCVKPDAILLRVPWRFPTTPPDPRMSRATAALRGTPGALSGTSVALSDAIAALSDTSAVVVDPIAAVSGTSAFLSGTIRRVGGGGSPSRPELICESSLAGSSVCLHTTNKSCRTLARVRLVAPVNCSGFSWTEGHAPPTKSSAAPIRDVPRSLKTGARLLARRPRAHDECPHGVRLEPRGGWSRFSGVRAAGAVSHAARSYLFRFVRTGAGDPLAALPHLDRAIVPREATPPSADWNDLVVAVKAFLRRDRATLLAVKDRVAIMSSASVKFLQRTHQSGRSARSPWPAIWVVVPATGTEKMICRIPTGPGRKRDLFTR
jgi:hypothetical protein